MKKTKLLLAILLLGLLGGVYHAAAIGTAFTYQGRLADNGSPASGNYDLRFSVWDSAVGGLQVGGSVVVAPVSVGGGLFTVPLDFGAGIFTCPDRWLQIESRVFGGPAYSLITPRQKLTPTPYAITAGSVCANPGAVQDVSLSANVALLNRTPQTFAGANIFDRGSSGPGRLIVTGDSSVDTTAFTGLGFQYYSSPGEGAIMSSYNDGYAYLSFYTKQGSGQPIRKQMIISQYGDVAIDQADANDGFLNNSTLAGAGLTFGSGSGEGIASKRTAGGNQYGLDFYTGFARRLSLSNSGNLSFIDPANSIIFPATSGANSPMIYMFDSGTGNADRMVIAHSPSFPTWGLQYSDAADKFNFLSGGTAVMTVDLGSQRIGIGTTTPTKAKVEINAVSGGYTYGQRGILNLNGATSGSNVGTDNNASLWASGNVWASAFLAFSDERMKRIAGRSDAAHDLSTLLGIEVTDYTYIDTVAKSAGKQKKVIAQQVEKVYPQAVSRNTDVVPDIYQKAEVKAGWVKLATNLKKGERVRLIGAKKEGIHEVLEVAQDKFRTDFAADGDEVFVFGREVKDFRSVDYEAIAMLNVSATQELNRRLEKQAAELAARDGKIATLEKANQEMQRELAAQRGFASRMQAEFATMQKAVARLADKTADTFALNHSPAEAQ